MARRLPGCIVAIVALVAMATAGGCKVDSVNPVTSPERAVQDRPLFGVWRYRSGGELGYVHIGPVFSLDRGDDRARRLRILIVDHKPNGLTDEAYEAHVSRVGEARYLNVLQSENGQPAGYILVRYRLAGSNELRFATIDEERLRAAISAGRIAGRTRGDGLSSETAMTASSEEVAAFLRREGARMFGPETTLRRVL